MKQSDDRHRQHYAILLNCKLVHCPKCLCCDHFPTNYVFISENNKVRVKENNHEKDVSSYNQVVGRIKDLMLTLVNGDFSNGKQFDPQYFQTKSEYIVKLKPRNKRMSNAFDYIQLSFNKKNLLLEELAFYEKSGDRNIMKFSNQMVNTELNDTLFKNF
ncbi:MAG TPA: outer membrane lipoprotein carrier protein LolA [Bacteroidia bacterium]|nr:outer membrane lipoprotein carrier protein LolA [Bacteroidia bacterium]